MDADIFFNLAFSAERIFIHFISASSIYTDGLYVFLWKGGYQKHHPAAAVLAQVGGDRLGWSHDVEGSKVVRVRARGGYYNLRYKKTTFSLASRINGRIFIFT